MYPFLRTRVLRREARYLGYWPLAYLSYGYSAKAHRVTMRIVRELSEKPLYIAYGADRLSSFAVSLQITIATEGRMHIFIDVFVCDTFCVTVSYNMSFW